MAKEDPAKVAARAKAYQRANRDRINAKRREARRLNPEKFRARDRARYHFYKPTRRGLWSCYGRQHIDRRLEFFRWIKLGVGCTDCGYNLYAEALDFDHVHGTKTEDISRLIRRKASWDALCEEVLKCEVVCANCHRVRTAARRAAAPPTPPTSTPVEPPVPSHSEPS